MPIDFNEQSIEDIDEDNRYNILIEVDGTESNSGRAPNMEIRFTDVDGGRYSIAVWDEPQTHLAREVEVGHRYKFTDVWYTTSTKNGTTYHNLSVNESTTVEEIEEEGISQQIKKAQTNQPVTSGSGHIITTFKSTEPVPFESLYKTNIILREDMEGTQRRQAYSARQELYSETDVEAVAVDSDDMVVYTVEPIDNLKTDNFEFKKVKSIGIELSDSKHKRLVESVVEEGMKNILRDEYKVRGIDEVLSEDSVRETDKFAMHKRYDISITVERSGYIYADIYFKHRLVSNLYVSDLDSVHFGLRVKKAYGNRSAYRVSNIRDEGTRERIPDIGNRSVYEYFDGRGILPSHMLEKVEHSSSNVLDLQPRKSYTNESTVYPQEVLVVEPSVDQIGKFDSEFKRMYYKNSTVSSSKYWSKISSFVQNNNKFAFSGHKIELDTSPVTNSKKRELKELYQRDAEVLRFKNGSKGHRPNDVFEHGAAEPVEDYKVAVICPEQNEDDVQNLMEELSNLLSGIDCTPDITKWLTYNPMEINMDELEMRIRKNIDNDLDCAVVNILDMSDLPVSYGDGEEQYNRIKNTLGEKGIPSQMVDRETIDGNIRESTMKNVALGLLACAGGIPFTPDETIPGDTDMFLGIDVASKFEGGADNKISVAATSVAVMSDGTILGRNTEQPQRGEKVSSENLRNSVMSAIVGYEEKVGERPEHIVIHRDGFLYESLDDVESLLENFSISYDIVEIRKHPQARILKWENKTAKIPDKGVAMIDKENNNSVLSTWGAPESQATSDYTGIPRPIQVSRKVGDTDIETLTEQVYLLAQAHIGVSNTTIRLPITTAYADKAGEAAINGWLVESDDDLTTQLGFL